MAAGITSTKPESVQKKMYLSANYMCTKYSEN